MSVIRKKIFLIEDSPEIQLLLERLLKEEGYFITTARNGKEAMAILNSDETLPDLILLDLMMPVMDGYEFRKVQMKTEGIREIPTVVMTADRDIDTKSKSLQAQGFLKKPFVDIDVILDTVAPFFADGSHS